MKFSCKGHNQPGIVLYGVMLALRYPVSKKSPIQRVSFPMFINSLSQIVRNMENPRGTVDQALGNVNEYIRHMYWLCGFPVDETFNPVTLSKDAMNGRLRIPEYVKSIMGSDRTPDSPSEFVHFGLLHIGGGDFIFQVEIDVADHKHHVEAAIMMQWMCLDYSMSTQKVTIESQTLSLGFWTAAKLYECGGDLVGKLATIDEGLDR